ncbi:hypothetical protein [Geothrix rubra]|nr:hypothetical protein [Geothrix rubra]
MARDIPGKSMLMRTVPTAMVALLLSAVSLLAADLTLTQTCSSRGHEEEQTQLWSSRFMRINHPESQVDFLVDFQQGVSYGIDHRKKLIQKMSWDDLELATEVSRERLKTLPPLVLRAMGLSDATVRVEEQGTEILLGHECRKWKICLGPMIIETSNDPSVHPPGPALPYQRFLRLQTLLGQLQPAPAPAVKMGEELAKVQGIALNYRVVLPVVGPSTTTTTRIEEGPISSSAFDLPPDYQMEDAGRKMLENLGCGFNFRAK